MLIARLNGAITSARSSLELIVPELTSDYEKAIGAYALSVVKSKLFAILLNGLESSPNRTISGKLYINIKRKETHIYL